MVEHRPEPRVRVEQVLHLGARNHALGDAIGASMSPGMSAVTSEAAEETSSAVRPGSNRHNLRDLTVAVENDNRLSARRTAYELARAVSELANLDPLHRR